MSCPPPAETATPTTRFVVQVNVCNLVAWISITRPGFVHWTYQRELALTFSQRQLDQFLPRLVAKFPVWRDAKIVEHVPVVAVSNEEGSPIPD